MSFVVRWAPRNPPAVISAILSLLRILGWLDHLYTTKENMQLAEDSLKETPVTAGFYPQEIFLGRLSAVGSRYRRWVTLNVSRLWYSANENEKQWQESWRQYEASNPIALSDPRLVQAKTRTAHDFFPFVIADTMVHEIVHKFIGYELARRRSVTGRIPIIQVGGERLSLDEIWTRRASESITDDMRSAWTEQLTVANS